MPFNTVKDYADYRNEGAWWQSTYLRTTAPVGAVTNKWVDLSIGLGQPSYNPYSGSPLTATQLIYNNNNSIYTGPAISASQTKHLHSLTMDTTATAGAPSTFILTDYLLHYPYVELDNTVEQEFDNIVSLPRYTDGDGVMCFVVLTPTVGANFNSSCTVKYTNSLGVTGKTTTFALIGSTNLGVLLNAGSEVTTGTSACSAFIPLADGDRGIRKIESITLSSVIATGGFAAFVLCNPIASIPLLTNITQTEKIFFSRTGRSPKIENGAFLNFLMCNGGTNAPTPATLRSSLTFVWG